MPSRKVGSAAIAGALSVLVVFGLTKLGIELPADVSSAITAVIGFAVGYIVPEGGPAFSADDAVL